MICFFLIVLAVALFNAELVPAGELNSDYISREHTRHINGLFTALIVLSHFVGYIDTSGTYDLPYIAVRQHLNQSVVCTFLFYSGYGIMESVNAKGKHYLRAVPVRRVLPILLRLIVSVLLFVLVQAFYKTYFDLTHILLCFIGWESVGNSNWYIHGILVLYLATWVSGLSLPEGRPWRYLHAALVTVLTACYALFLREAGKEAWWYNTLLLYPAGMWYSLLRERVEKLLQREGIWYLAMLSVLLLYAVSLDRRNQSLKYFTVWVLCFMAVVVLLSMKLKLRSPFLNFMGQHIFSIYILQRIPMLILSRCGFLAAHKYIGLSSVFAGTCFMSIVFDKYMDRLVDVIFHPRGAGGTGRI